jgi:regulator of protease activity HflC (stomatin/prohibitin superfamily)
VFWIGLFLALLAIVGVGVTVLSSNEDTKAVSTLSAAVLGVLSVLSIVIASADKVDTRNVGIVTEFGRPVGVRNTGITWHMPWQHIYEMSEAIQLQAFDGESYDKPGTAVQVRLKNNSAAYVSLNLNWRLRPGSAPKLFENYGGSNADVFSEIRENLVDRQAHVALANEFAKFDPTSNLETGPDGQLRGNLTAVDLAQMAVNVKNDLQAAVGEDIEIVDVRIPRLFYDGETQRRIDAFNQKVQETQNAQQDIITAQKRKEANDLIAQSVHGDLAVVIAQCINEQINKNRDPQGCWPIGGSPMIQMPQGGR